MQVATAPVPQPDRIVPLTADLRRVHVTLSRRVLEKVEAARAALSHSHPGASLEEILEAGLDLVLERHAKRRGMVETPQEKVRPAKPETVPARVKREVWARDGGRCQFPLASGGVCGSTVRVQIHHREAKARGGPPTADNLVCACAFHNDLAARRDFGDAWMDRFSGRGKGDIDPSPSPSSGPRRPRSKDRGRSG